jgi:hypothetical protein
MAKSYIPHYQPAEDKALELCEGLKTQQEKFDAITAWLTRNIIYDYVRATRVRELLGPDVERCFDLHLGICLDIAALAACMFRAVGMVTNIAIGNCTSIYTVHTEKGDRVSKYGPTWHAWNEILVNGKKVIWDQVIAKKNWSINSRDGRLVWTANYKVSHIRK